MQLSYDLDAGALYITLQEGQVARTREVDDNTFVDLDETGRALGIEVISIAHLWAVDQVLSEFSLPPVEEAQIRAYFGSRIVATPDVKSAQPPAIPVAA